MGIRRVTARLTKAGVFLGLLSVGAVYGWTFLDLYPARSDLRATNTIVCLAAGLQDDGSLGRFTEQRARSCISLYHQGLAPKIAFTGGNSTHAAPPTGQQMAALALAEGVPASAIVIENQSESTLQNALFTLPKLESVRGVILVTDSFHLPRSGLSFLWAGARDIQLFPAYDPSQTLMPGHWTIAMEAVKLWANALRAQVYSMAGLLGIPDSTKIQILH
ncbi:hypothetical protein TRM7557_03797 [Tritonibacter multivorans]|uniref:DUF218 domain-containing protein n=1 Tax=Tritonibacter multivorans TaxID=928856 RepID=A0A0P1H1T0_9RHOB|nr:YdcF family protein [Tritonibacter multivorans]MDA7421556.1 YdcF family protein [Tritonibacter multivorans]CUH82181.1 hypothetical protein TRM7557_03797 [Tritonibacter multivorans]SFC95729.1 DUF218 domain-containing protein [Tritonibacter multivorans]